MAASVNHTAILCELDGRIKNLPETLLLRSPVAPLNHTASGKILLQPRLCTLRSYGSGDIRSPAKSSGGSTSLFFPSLADYVESARTSRDFETLSGRIAMIAFATAVGVEFVTGDSLFKKLDLTEISGAVGICVLVVSSAAIFAWFSSARARIGQILTLRCNYVVDSLIDNIIDGLFYENELSECSDEI